MGRSQQKQQTMKCGVLTGTGVASAEEVAQNVAWLAESESVGAPLWVDAKQLGLLSQIQRYYTNASLTLSVKSQP